MGIPCLYVIVPCYNEEEVLPITSQMFLNELKQMISDKLISEDSKIMFVDDGSRDNTWKIILSLSKVDKHFIGIRQSRNRGHQNAVIAGLMESKDACDITISADADGQDDITAMRKMVEAYLNGSDVVYGVRKSREKDSFFKRTSAQLYYQALNSLSDGEVVYNHADYRLLSHRVLTALEDFQEVNLYLRGLIPLIGFQSTQVYYDRENRLAGKTHYPLKKMLALAWQGITSLSVKPLRLVTFLGIIICIFGVTMITYAIIQHARGNTAAGWASIICAISFIGGIQLIALGIIGEYIGKIYLEVKHRPRYIISERSWEQNEEAERG